MSTYIGANTPKTFSPALSQSNLNISKAWHNASLSLRDVDAADLLFCVPNLRELHESLLLINCTNMVIYPHFHRPFQWDLPWNKPTSSIGVPPQFWKPPHWCDLEAWQPQRPHPHGFPRLPQASPRQCVTVLEPFRVHWVTVKFQPTMRCQFWVLKMGVSINGVPKMDGLFHGKSHLEVDNLGAPLF